MKKFRLIVLAALMIVSSLTFAQEKVKVSGFVQGLYQIDIKGGVCEVLENKITVLAE